MDDHPPTYEEAMELNVPPPTYEEAMEPPSHFDIFGEAAPTNETTNFNATTTTIYYSFIIH